MYGKRRGICMIHVRCCVRLLGLRYRALVNIVGFQPANEITRVEGQSATVLSSDALLLLTSLDIGLVVASATQGRGKVM
jgi:hypothetical protein